MTVRFLFQIIVTWYFDQNKFFGIGISTLFMWSVTLHSWNVIFTKRSLILIGSFAYPATILSNLTSYFIDISGLGKGYLLNSRFFMAIRIVNRNGARNCPVEIIVADPSWVMMIRTWNNIIRCLRVSWLDGGVGVSQVYLIGLIIFLIVIKCNLSWNHRMIS